MLKRAEGRLVLDQNKTSCLVIIPAKNTNMWLVVYGILLSELCEGLKNFDSCSQLLLCPSFGGATAFRLPGLHLESSQQLAEEDSHQEEITMQ